MQATIDFFGEGQRYAFHLSEVFDARRHDATQPAEPREQPLALARPHPVDLLDAGVRTRFAIEAAPTTVEADGDAFVVRELVPRGGT